MAEHREENGNKVLEILQLTSALAQITLSRFKHWRCKEEFCYFMCDMCIEKCCRWGFDAVWCDHHNSNLIQRHRRSESVECFSIYMYVRVFYVSMYLHVIYFSCMFVEGVKNDSRKGIRLVWSQNKPSVQELPAPGSHLSHKEATAGKCLHRFFFLWGALGLRTETCVFMHWKVGVETTWECRPRLDHSPDLPWKF